MWAPWQPSAQDASVKVDMPAIMPATQYVNIVDQPMDTGATTGYTTGSDALVIIDKKTKSGNQVRAAGTRDYPARLPKAAGLRSQRRPVLKARRRCPVRGAIRGRVGVVLAVGYRDGQVRASMRH